MKSLLNKTQEIINTALSNLVENLEAWIEDNRGIELYFDNKEVLDIHLDKDAFGMRLQLDLGYKSISISPKKLVSAAMNNHFEFRYKSNGMPQWSYLTISPKAQDLIIAQASKDELLQPYNGYFF